MVSKVGPNNGLNAHIQCMAHIEAGPQSRELHLCTPDPRGKWGWKFVSTDAPGLT